MLDIPAFTIGEKTDQAYYRQCFDEGWGATLGLQPKNSLNNLLNLSKIYVCNASHVSFAMMEAMKCGCYILCSSRNEMAGRFKKDGFWVYDHDDQRDFEEKLWDACRQTRMVQKNKSWWDIDHNLKIII
jgi:hypothetical protein